MLNRIKHTYRNWTTHIPIYVTRPIAGNKETGYASVAGWWFVPTQLLIMANITGWSAFGLYELVSKIA
jgi:hypothetical protein